MEMKHLVTGGAGFIGSNLVRHLAEQGVPVRVFDNLSSGHLDNLAGLEASVDFIQGDLRDAEAVRAALRGIRHVFHIGALASVQASVDDPATTHAVNATGTLNVLLAAREVGAAHVVVSSSASVYGDSPAMPKREDMRPEPLTGYALSKLDGEHYGRIFHDLYGLQAFSLRYFNVFGPRQDPASHYAAVIPLFMRAYAAGRQPTIFGDGEQTRDFTFVADIVAANLACLAAPPSAAGGVYNVAYGDRVSINDLARQIAALADQPFAPAYELPRPGDIRESQADASQARRVLGWTPQHTFADGLAATWDWFKDRFC
ncbi:MAG: SDR family NAD(P)-dependent oxidoreductase [Kiritimatiellia bacterium]|jgi:nucleoside-diphosphate-sugar epimerase|nr:SDR family NAD(P)-dependent oxidoreductase [Kiritimatiellia bacterium]